MIEPILVISLAILFVSILIIVLIGARLIPAFVSRTVGLTSTPRASADQNFEQVISGRVAALGSRLQKRLVHYFPLFFREERWQDSALQRKFVRAGYRHYSIVSLWLGAIASAALAGLTITVLALVSIGTRLSDTQLLLVALLGVMIGALLPGALLEWLIRRRQREIMEHFPDALDLIRICLEAGLGLDSAIQRVGQEFQQASPALFDEFHVLSLELRAGAGRAQAMRNLALRTGLKEVQSWVTMITQSEKFGTGIAEAVRIHSDQLRITRRMNAEERAAKLSTKLLFPLVFCIFPALLLVLLGPAGITIQGQLGTHLESTK